MMLKILYLLSLIHENRGWFSQNRILLSNCFSIPRLHLLVEISSHFSLLSAFSLLTPTYSDLFFFFKLSRSLKTVVLSSSPSQLNTSFQSPCHHEINTSGFLLLLCILMQIKRVSIYLITGIIYNRGSAVLYWAIELIKLTIHFCLGWKGPYQLHQLPDWVLDQDWGCPGPHATWT